MDGAAQLVKSLLETKKTFPARFEVTDPVTKKMYAVEVRDLSLYEDRASMTKVTIGGSGAKCGCCNGTGKG